jgi:hypothetical protein
MRTTVFAFMGLVAAGGLALVAIFVQMGFPVISPAPLPSDPSRFNAVDEAKVVSADRGLGPAVPAPRADRGTDRQAEGGGTAGDTLRSASDEVVATPAAPPADSGGVSTPADGGGAGAPATSAPDPAPAPAAPPVPTSVPKPAPAPVTASPQRPETTPPPPPAPAPVAAPGNSSSGAAAAHASERGIEASSKSTAAAPAAAPPTPPGNGNAVGHSK